MNGILFSLPILGRTQANLLPFKDNALMTTWADFRDGYFEYLNAEKELERDELSATRNAALHLLSNDRTVNKDGEPNPFSTDAVRHAWTEFVSDIVQPQLACHELTFCTWTFKNLQGEPPTLTRARKRTKELIDVIYDQTRAFVIVEERGKINDRLHLHGLLLRDITRDLPAALHQTVRQVWHDEGWYKMEPAKNAKAACTYSAKYIAKGQFDGDLAFWAKRDTTDYQTVLPLHPVSE